MTLIGLIIVLVVVGAALYVLNLLPIDATVLLWERDMTPLTGWEGR